MRHAVKAPLKKGATTTLLASESQKQGWTSLVGLGRCGWKPLHFSHRLLCMWTVPLLSPCFTLTFSKSCPKVILLMALPASEEWTRTEVCAGPGSGHLGMDFLCPRSGSGYWELDPEAGRRLQVGTSLYPVDLAFVGRGMVTG